MRCEGCEKEVGDLKALKVHRKTCGKYAAWDAHSTPIEQVEPIALKYEGRALPRLF